MNNRAPQRVLLVSVASLVLAFPITVYAQAAAESALTHALSSTATVKAGTSFGRALNQSSNQLGARIQERTSSPAQSGPAQLRLQTVPRTGTAMKNRITGASPGGAVVTGSSSGSFSVRGGAAACSPVNSSNQASVDAANRANPTLTKTTSGISPAPPDCRGTNSATDSANKYKSFVTLSFPK